jgi:cytochrome c
MKDCIKGKVNLVRIKTEINDFHPPMSIERSLPKVKEGAKSDSHPGKKLYDASCAVCHSTDKMGAPDIGNKQAWTEVLKKGIDKVYANGINGINGMPPKGGANVSDKEFNEAVDYMIEASK